MTEDLIIQNLRLFELLIGDVHDCKKQAWVTGDQFWRRMYVRALFAFIESNVHGLRQIVHYLHLEHKAPLSRAELAVLLEEAYDVAENGEVRTKPSWIRSDRSIRFAFRIMIHTYSLPIKI